jgi:hypothetical protein
MMQAIAAFMETCYVARRNAISASALERFRGCVDRFYELRDIFITVGVRTSISLPRQHALFHYYHSIQLFGSPNGLCSSITESKHIKAVKEPWRRSSRYKALSQMLRTILRLEKMAALRRIFGKRGMLTGTTASYMARTVREDAVPAPLSDTEGDDGHTGGHDQAEEDVDEGDDGGPIDGMPSDSLSDVKLAARIRKYLLISLKNIQCST